MHIYYTFSDALSIVPYNCTRIVYKIGKSVIAVIKEVHLGFGPCMDGGGGGESQKILKINNLRIKLI